MQIAKILGAARVVAAGRNQPALETLHDLGADATISLTLPESELHEAFQREAGQSGFQVVIDYLWGRPAEVFLTTMTKTEFAAMQSEIRYVQVGESAAPTITLPAAVLCSTAITLTGTAGIPPREVLTDAFQQVMTHAAKGDLRIDTERIPLADIESVWQRDPAGRRLVIIP